MKKKSNKCYIYIRVSTNMQVDGYSLDAQKDRLTKFADFKGMEIVREYCDAGKSGKSITGRPEFTQMLQDVADDRDGVSYILVFKLSRFGRNAADVLTSLQYIQDFGVNLICVEDGIDSAKDSGKLTITVLSAVAEIERENILVQTMEGRKQKAREGKWNGGQPPFGYSLDSKTSTLIVDPEEAEIVKIVYDQFVKSDMGMDRIASYLNDHGYTKKRNREREITYFTRPLIKRILDNPVYTGKIAYGRIKPEKVKGSRDEYRRVQAEEFLTVDGKHEAIISEDLWNEAQAKRKKTGLKWNKTHSLEHEHILSGLLKCPVCGSGLVGTVRRHHYKATGGYKDTFYYRCTNRKKIDDDHFCNFKLSLNQETVNAELEDILRDMVHNSEFRDVISSKLNESVNVSGLEEERDRFREQLRQVTGAKNKLTEQLDRLDVNDRHYDRKYQDMQDRLDRLYDKIGELEDSIADVNGRIQAAYGEQITAHDIYEILLDFDKMYEEASDFEKKEFMQNLIESIEIYPERTPDGRILKQIDLNFPVYYGGVMGDRIGLLNENNVECVALLVQQYETVKTFVNVSLDMDEYRKMKDRN